MHGLVNRCIELFMRGTYGPGLWEKVTREVGVDPEGFLTWSAGPDKVTYSIVIASARLLDKSVGEFLEDIGAWLTRQEDIRRLLRFSGSTFEEFVESLRELPGRIRLVIPDFQLPALAVTSPTAGRYHIAASAHQPGLLRVVAGMLRGMADDYGALAIISVMRDCIDIDVALSDYSGKRRFVLSHPQVAP